MPPKKDKSLPAISNAKEEKKKIIISESEESDIDEEDVEVEEIEEVEEWDEEDEDEENENNNEDDEIDMETDAGDDDDCVYTTMRKNGKAGINRITSNIDKDDDDDIDITDNKIGEFVPSDQRMTSPNLNKYEMVRIIGDRTMQLTLGAKPMIKNITNLNPRDIAQLELEAKLIPIKIIRPLPDGRREIWSLNELNIRKQFIKFNK